MRKYCRGEHIFNILAVSFHLQKYLFLIRQTLANVLKFKDLTIYFVVPQPFNLHIKTMLPIIMSATSSQTKTSEKNCQLQVMTTLTCLKSKPTTCRRNLNIRTHNIFSLNSQPTATCISLTKLQCCTFKACNF